MTLKPTTGKVSYPCLTEKFKGKDGALVEFRDTVRQFERKVWTFYQNHPGADATTFAKFKSKEGSFLMSTVPLSATESQRLYWKSRIAYAMNPYLESVLEFADRALRYNAFLVDAYFLLADYHWNFKDVASVKTLLTDAYNLEKSPKTMAYMSFLHRAMYTQMTDKAMREMGIQKAIEMAKQALKLDPDYVFAQYNLGMSYFYLFFLPGRKNEHILKCGMAICEKAITNPKDPFVRSDVYYNLAEGYIFLQQYDKAIDCLRQAQKLDGVYTESKELADLFTDLKAMYLEFDKHRSSLSIQKTMNRMDDSGDSEELTIPDLMTDQTAVIIVKVLAHIPSTRPVPKHYVVSDTSSNVAIMSCYNVSESVKILVKNYLTLVSPIAHKVNVEYLGELTILRVLEPEKLLRNGKALDQSEIQPTSLAINNP